METVCGSRPLLIFDVLALDRPWLIVVLPAVAVVQLINPRTCSVLQRLQIRQQMRDQDKRRAVR